MSRSAFRVVVVCASSFLAFGVAAYLALFSVASVVIVALLQGLAVGMSVDVIALASVVGSKLLCAANFADAVLVVFFPSLAMTFAEAVQAFTGR